MGRASRRKWTAPSEVKWTPWQCGVMPPDYYTARGAEARDEEVFINNVYQVIRRRVHSDAERRGESDVPVLWHLSIKRLDKRVVRDWRDFQRIKTDLVGPEAEGVELYPAESRLIDQANQYHLWVFEAPFRFPFGFDEGRAVANESPTGGRQRQYR